MAFYPKILSPNYSIIINDNELCHSLLDSIKFKSNAALDLNQISRQQKRINICKLVIIIIIISIFCSSIGVWYGRNYYLKNIVNKYNVTTDAIRLQQNDNMQICRKTLWTERPIPTVIFTCPNNNNKCYGNEYFTFNNNVYMCYTDIRYKARDTEYTLNYMQMYYFDIPAASTIDVYFNDEDLSLDI